MKGARFPTVVLAGGASRRMGVPDKCLVELDGRPLLSHILGRLETQASSTLLNTNSDPEKFRTFGFPVRADTLAGRLGPLAGILTGLEWARETHPDAEYLLSVPSDTPFLPLNLAQRLSAQAQPSPEIAMAVCGAQIHPTVALWPIAFAGRLAQLVKAEGLRKMQGVFQQLPSRVVQFPASESFTNINTPRDLDLAQETHTGYLRNIA